MKIVHNIALSVSRKEKHAFAELDIELGEGFSNFKIEESDARWPEIQQLVERFQASDIASTKFSAAEIKGAHHLKVLADSHNGYPQPSDDFGYIDVTYDTSRYCSECGIGLSQKAPFRFGTRPKLGKRHLFSLNWVFDELFVLRDAWEDLLKTFGVNIKHVIDAKTMQEINEFVQIDIPQTDLRLDLAGHSAEVCRLCRRTKYEPITRGFIPKLIGKTELHLFKPAPYFGSGASAHHAIFMSAALYKAVSDAKLRGLDTAVVCGG